MNIEGKTFFITGANRGIGHALVEAALQAGARKVYATCRSAGKLGPLAEHPQVHELVLDVRDAEACVRVAADAQDADILVNNAGTLRSYALLAADPDDLQTDFATNTFGLLNMARAFTPGLTARPEAAMVNLLTLVSVASMPGIGGYSASKAAAWSITQALRAELSPRGVRVVGVFPGAVDTDMIRAFEMAKADPSAVANAIVEGLRNDEEDIAPDAMSQEMYGTFLRDPKAVERAFANL